MALVSVGKWKASVVRPEASWALSLYCLELYALTSMARCDTQPIQLSRAVEFPRFPKFCSMDSQRNDAVGKSKCKR